MSWWMSTLQFVWHCYVSAPAPADRKGPLFCSKLQNSNCNVWARFVLHVCGKLSLVVQFWFRRWWMITCILPKSPCHESNWNDCPQWNDPCSRCSFTPDQHPDATRYVQIVLFDLLSYGSDFEPDVIYFTVFPNWFGELQSLRILKSIEYSYCMSTCIKRRRSNFFWYLCTTYWVVPSTSRIRSIIFPGFEVRQSPKPFRRNRCEWWMMPGRGESGVQEEGPFGRVWMDDITAWEIWWRSTMFVFRFRWCWNITSKKRTGK